MLEAINLDVELGRRPVLRDVSIGVGAGEIVALVGPNGAGKSTLAACLSGLLRPTGGAAKIDGDDLAALRPIELARRRAFLEQNPVSHAPFRVSELVMLAIPREIEPNAADICCAKAIDTLDLSAIAERSIFELSGGERHRAHMARVLAQLDAGRALGGGGWLLLDEPTASLDPRHQLTVLRAAKSAAADGVGVVMALHDLTLAANIADRIVVMKDGGVIGVGPPARTLTSPLLSDAYDTPIDVLSDAGDITAVLPRYA